MPLLPILLAVAARDLYLPVAGRVHDPLHDVRTTITLRNTSARDARATVRFIPAAGTPAQVKPLEVVIPPKSTRDIDPFGDANALGAFHVTSDQPVAANGRIAGSAFDAIPSSDAITTGEAARLDGFDFTHAAGATNRLYLVETSGDALQYTVVIRGAGGNVLAQSLGLIHAHEQHSLDLDQTFPTITARNATVLLRGMNGGGSIVAAAAITSRANGAVTAREMKVTERRARGLSTTEKLAYAAIALFILGASLRRRR